MIVEKDIDFSKPLTSEEIEMLKIAEKMPIEFDDDCPEQTEEQLKEFLPAAKLRHDECKKQNVTLRLSPQAIKKAKSLGEGYTSVLSSFLEKALMDNSVKRT